MPLTQEERWVLVVCLFCIVGIVVGRAVCSF